MCHERPLYRKRGRISYCDILDPKSKVVVNATFFLLKGHFSGEEGAQNRAKRGSDLGRNLLDKELRHDGGGCSAKV